MKIYMEAEHKYEINLQWVNSRKGVISSPVLELQIEVATPPDFPKGIAGIWSPEHLYIGAVNSCFMTTFLAVAENSGLEFTKFECHATGTVEKNRMEIPGYRYYLKASGYRVFIKIS